MSRSSFLKHYERGGRNVLMLWAITPQGIIPYLSDCFAKRGVASHPRDMYTATKLYALLHYPWRNWARVTEARKRGSSS